MKHNLKILQEIRKAKGLTQEQLADIMNTNVKYISEMENKKVIRRSTIEKYLKALDLPFECYVEILERNMKAVKPLTRQKNKTV